jgi:hypothetical protein
VNKSARAARVPVSDDGRGLVSQAGAVLLRETMRVTGLGRACRKGWPRGGRRARCMTRARSSRTWQPSDGVERSRDVHVRVGVHAASDGACLYDGHSHPFSG